MNNIKKIIEKTITPRKEFIDRTHATFFAAFSQKYPAPFHTPYVFRYFFRGLVAGVALMIAVGGTASYAYETNVGATSALYPLKRSYEKFTLAIASQEAKPEIHLKLAERRIHEIERVKTENRESPRIQKLVNDFEKEIVSSLVAREELPHTVVNEFVQKISDKPVASQGSSPPSHRAPITKEERAVRGEIFDETNALKLTPTIPSTQTQGEINFPQAAKKLSPFCDSLQKIISTDILEVKMAIEKDEFIKQSTLKKCS